MTMGIFVNYDRPKSKKVVKEAMQAAPESISLEATSIFGNEYDGPLVDAPVGVYTFVGPSPHKRNFFGNITVAVKNGQRTYKLA